MILLPKSFLPNKIVRFTMEVFILHHLDAGLLNLCTSFIILEWTDTLLEVYNCMKSDLLSYLLGMMAVVLVMVCLRYDGQCQKQGLCRQLIQAKAPPVAAFRYPWSCDERDDNAQVSFHERRCAKCTPASYSNWE